MGVTLPGHAPVHRCDWLFDSGRLTRPRHAVRAAYAQAPWPRAALVYGRKELPPASEGRLTRPLAAAPLALSFVDKAQTVVWDVAASRADTGAATLTTVVTGPLDLPPISACPVNTENPFRRVVVDYRVLGGARISWELSRHFTDPAPRSFQLQYSRGGIATADDWTNIGGAQNDPAYLQDDTQRLFGKSMPVRYRVVLTTPVTTYLSPIASPLGHLGKHDWLIIREMLRKEQLRHRLFGSSFGYLLKARRWGTTCSCVDSCSGNIKDSQCASCYGTGFVGGYHPALPCRYAELTPEDARESREIESNLGTTRPVVVRGRFLGDVPLTQADVWVSGQGSDERYRVHRVTEGAAWKGVPIVYLAELRPVAFTDILYSVPISS